MRKPDDEFEIKGAIFMSMLLASIMMLLLAGLWHSVSETILPIHIVLYVVGGLGTVIIGMIVPIGLYSDDIDFMWLFEKPGQKKYR